MSRTFNKLHAAKFCGNKRMHWEGYTGPWTASFAAAGQHTCSRRCNVVRTARQVIATRTRLQVVAAALDPDNTSILVCGGAGTAMHTTRKLKDMGAWVWMLQRTDKNRPDIEKMMAFCVKGDAMKPDSIKKAMDGLFLLLLTGSLRLLHKLSGSKACCCRQNWETTSRT
jgi:hypothetical protein